MDLSQRSLELVSFLAANSFILLLVYFNAVNPSLFACLVQEKCLIIRLDKAASYLLEGAAPVHVTCLHISAFWIGPSNEVGSSRPNFEEIGGLVGVT